MPQSVSTLPVSPSVPHCGLILLPLSTSAGAESAGKFAASLGWGRGAQNYFLNEILNCPYLLFLVSQGVQNKHIE